MPITSYRAVEPLYIVTMRNNTQAETMLKAWIKSNHIEHASVNGNRMMLHDQRGFEQFRITWKHEVDHITVWDTWNRRHIYLE